MPGLDGTGPRGAGSMTGRGFGKCRVGPGRTEVVSSMVQTPDGAVESDIYREQPISHAPFNGAGRNGMPCGCGKGRRFGGGRGCRQA